jgi:hypothetical protein
MEPLDKTRKNGILEKRRFVFHKSLQGLRALLCQLRSEATGFSTDQEAL